MANERGSILLALGMGLLAGMLAALGIVLFSSSVAVATEMDTTPVLRPGVDLVTEEVGQFEVGPSLVYVITPEAATEVG